MRKRRLIEICAILVVLVGYLAKFVLASPDCWWSKIKAAVLLLIYIIYQVVVFCEIDDEGGILNLFLFSEMMCFSGLN